LGSPGRLGTAQIIRMAPDRRCKATPGTLTSGLETNKSESRQETRPAATTQARSGFLRTQCDARRNVSLAWHSSAAAAEQEPAQAPRAFCTRGKGRKKHGIVAGEVRPHANSASRLKLACVRLGIVRNRQCASSRFGLGRNSSQPLTSRCEKREARAPLGSHGKPMNSSLTPRLGERGARALPRMRRHPGLQGA
jgi:hypothetical protein